MIKSVLMLTLLFSSINLFSEIYASDSEDDEQYLKKTEDVLKEIEKQVEDLKTTPADLFAEKFFQTVEYLDNNQDILCSYTESMSDTYQKNFLKRYDKFLGSLNLTQQILNADWTLEYSQKFWDLYSDDQSYLSNFFPVDYEKDHKIFL